MENSIYEKHEMEINPYEENFFVVCSYSDGGDTGWSVDSINPNQSDS